MVRSKLSQKGLDKFTTLSSKAMRAYSKKYKDSGKKYTDEKRDDFYEFVARNRLRKKSK